LSDLVIREINIRIRDTIPVKEGEKVAEKEGKA